MPPMSQDQVIAARIAKHEPGKLFKRNRGLLKMSEKELHGIASASTNGLPRHKRNLMKEY